LRNKVRRELGSLLGQIGQKMGIFKHFGQSGMGYPVNIEKMGAGLWKSDSVSEMCFGKITGT